MSHLWHKISWAFVGNVVYMVCQWSLLIIISKLGTATQLGQFALGLAIATPVAVFANLALRQVQATDIGEHYYFGDYLALRIVAVMCALVSTSIIVFVGQYGYITSLVIMAVAAAKLVEAFSDVCYGQFQQREYTEYIAKSMILRGVLAMAMMALLLYTTNSILWAAMGMAISWGCVLLAYDVRKILTASREATEHASLFVLRPRWKMEVQRKLFWMALPMGLVSLSVALTGSIPRLAVEYFLGSSQLGVFAAISYLMLTTNVVMASIGQAGAPRLARYFANGSLQQFFSLTLQMVAVGTLLGGAGIIIAAFFGDIILAIMYTPAYSQHQSLLVWIMVASTFLNVTTTLGFAINASRRFVMRLPVVATALLATTLACLFLIPGGQLGGAGAALAISTCCQALVSAAVLVFVSRSRSPSA